VYEREYEIAACNEALDAAAAGEGGCVILHGGAGTGKSALLVEVARQALNRGMMVLQLRGSHAEHDLPLSCVISVVRFVAEQLAGDAEGPPGESVGGSPLDALNGWDIGHVVPPEKIPSLSRDLLFTLVRMLEGAARRPLLLAVDNLHWTDRSSLRVLSTLLERLPSLPMALVATVCDGVRGTDEELLDDVVAGAALRLKVKPLSFRGTAAVIEAKLGQAPHPAFVSEALRATDGNPLLLVALLRTVAEARIRPGGEEAGRLRSLSVDSLAPSLRVRLRRISPEAITIFRIAAVLGDDTTVQNIAALSGLAPDEIVDNCHSMQKMGLLSVMDTTVISAQPLVADSVLRDSSPTVLQSVHAHAARLLHDFGASDHQVATHLLVGGALADAPWVCETLRSAAREAVAAHDIPTAVKYLRRALDEPMSETSRAAVQTELASATASADVHKAAGLVQRALKLSPDEVGRKATPDLLIMLGLGEYWDDVRYVYRTVQGRRAAEFDPCLLVLEQLVGGEPKAIAAQTGRSDEGTGVPGGLVRACLLARSGEDRDVAVALASHVAQGAAYSIEHLTHQLVAARVLSVAGELAAAMQLLETVVNAAEAGRQRSVLVVALTERARVALRLGRLALALADARRAFRTVRETGYRSGTAVFTAVVAQMVRVLTETGSADEALALIEDERAGMQGADRSSAVLLYALGRLRLSTGDARGGVRDLLACGEQLGARQVVDPVAGDWRSPAALGLAGLGEGEEARRLLAEELSWARRWGAPGAEAGVLRVQAMLAEPAAALPIAQDAVALLRRSEERLSLTHALGECGKLLAAVDVGAARQSLKEAYELAATFGNDDLATGISRELIRLGGRVPRPQQQGVEALTSSERRVAVLAAQGRKNREIAASLYVEKRTVEIHLTHTYRKLGINSRAELAEILGQDGDARAPEGESPFVTEYGTRIGRSGTDTSTTTGNRLR
jgi:DNA-binding CsgD family transcriptional regulator